MLFIKNNWEWASWFLTASVGLGLFGLSFRNTRAMLAAAAIAGCLVMAGVIYNKGVAAEHARILAEAQAANALALEKMAVQKKIDDAELARLKELVELTPPSSDRVALAAERAKRVGAVR